MNRRAAVFLGLASVVSASVGVSVFLGTPDEKSARRGEDILRFHRFGKLMDTTLFDFLEASTSRDSYTVTAIPPGVFDSLVMVHVRVNAGPQAGHYMFEIDMDNKAVHAADSASKHLAAAAQDWAQAKNSPSAQ